MKRTIAIAVACVLAGATISQAQSGETGYVDPFAVKADVPSEQAQSQAQQPVDHRALTHALAATSLDQQPMVHGGRAQPDTAAGIRQVDEDVTVNRFILPPAGPIRTDRLRRFTQPPPTRVNTLGRTHTPTLRAVPAVVSTSRVLLVAPSFARGTYAHGRYHARSDGRHSVRYAAGHHHRPLRRVYVTPVVHGHVCAAGCGHHHGYSRFSISTGYRHKSGIGYRYSIDNCGNSSSALSINIRF